MLTELGYDDTGCPNLFKDIMNRTYTYTKKSLERELIARALNKEQRNQPLNEIERKALIDAKLGQAWAESNELKIELEEKLKRAIYVKKAIEEGKIAVNYPVSDFDIAELIYSLLKMFEDGEITSSMLNNQVKLIGTGMHLNIQENGYNSLFDTQHIWEWHPDLVDRDGD